MFQNTVYLHVCINAMSSQYFDTDIGVVSQWLPLESLFYHILDTDQRLLPDGN